MKSPATSPTCSAATDNFVRSFCPRCDDLMVAPARSQHVNADVIRHWWSCKSCGHEFRTTVHLSSFIPMKAHSQTVVA